MRVIFIEQSASVGVLLTAMACPACWPLFALLGSSLGLGILAPWEGVLMNYVFPPFVVLGAIGSILSFKSHNKIIPLLIGLASAAMILFGFYAGWLLVLMYVGIFGMMLASVLSYIEAKKRKEICSQ
jgi:mercuric ion transport protein